MKNREGTHHMDSRFWPTSQQVVLVEGAQVEQWLDAMREQQEAARDVVDLWDETAHITDLDHALTHARRMDLAVLRLRHSLYQVRQWDVEP